VMSMQRKIFSVPHNALPSFLISGYQGVPYVRVQRSGPSLLLYDAGIVDQTSALLASGVSPI
jgi:hypothetical protein